MRPVSEISFRTADAAEIKKRDRLATVSPNSLQRSLYAAIVI